MNLDNVIIIGGGIGGLALALALRNHELPAQVYEQTSTYRDTGSGLVLAPNGVKALDRLKHGIGERVRQVGRSWGPGEDSPFLTWKGKVVMEADTIGRYPERYGVPAVSLLRHELHTILRDALGGNELRVGAEFTTFDENEQTITIRFADGQQASGDVLVGADGVRSPVRAQLLGNTPPRYTGITSVRGVVYNLDHSYARTGFLSTGPGTTVFCSPIGGNGLYWVVTIAAPERSWPRDAVTARDMLLERLRGWHVPVREMIEQSGIETVLVTDIHDRDPVQSWSRGRATLLGDAAHPMAPTMGQGANMALEDSTALADALKHAPTHTEAFVRYETQRVERANKVVMLSRQYTSMNTIENKLVYNLMSQMMSVMMRFMDQRKQDDWLFGYQP